MNRGKAGDWRDVSLDTLANLRGATDRQLSKVKRALSTNRKVQMQKVVFTAHCEIYVEIDGADAFQLSVDY